MTTANQTATLNISGMTCQGCVANVTRILKSVPGVQQVSVELRPGTATVVYDPAATDPMAMRTAVEDAGYGASA